MRSFTFLCFIYLSSLSIGHAAGFDCSKATSKNEKAICADHHLSLLDEQYSALYADVRKNSRNKDEIRKTAIAEFQWRELTCADNACLRSWYVRRITALSPLKDAPISLFNSGETTNQPTLTIAELYDRFNYWSTGKNYAQKQCQPYISQRAEFGGVQILSPTVIEATDGNIGLADRLEVLGPDRISVQRYGLEMRTRKPPVEYKVEYDSERREWRVAGTTFEVPEHCLK